MREQYYRRGPMWSLLVWAGVAVTVVSSYFVIRDVDFGEVWDALRASNLWWLAPALVLLALGIFIRAVRWQVLFAHDSRPPLRAVSEALLVGYFFNNVLPVRAGEAARVVALNIRAGTSRAEAGGTVVVERAYDVVSLLALLFVALPWLPEVSWLRAAAILAIVVAGSLATAIVLLGVYGERLLLFVARPFTRLPFVPDGLPERIARNATQGLFALRRARSGLLAFGWTTLSWIVFAFSFWLVMLGFDLGLSPVAGLLVVIAIGLAMILPSSPAALGVFEGATVVALAAYGISESRALSFALVLHVLNFLPFIVAGLWALHATAAAGRRRPRLADPAPSGDAARS